jgi:hypothetical protein
MYYFKYKILEETFRKLIIFYVNIYIMDKLYIFAIAIGVLILVGFLYSKMNTTTTTTTTTTKAVVVKQPVPVYVAPRYGPPPPHYNAYKNQYY